MESLTLQESERLIDFMEAVFTQIDHMNSTHINWPNYGQAVIDIEWAIDHNIDIRSHPRLSEIMKQRAERQWENTQ